MRVEPPLLRLGEGGSGRYRVRLNTRPSGDVAVTATSGANLRFEDGAQRTGVLTLTFMTENWNVERDVCVLARTTTRRVSSSRRRRVCR